MTPIPCFTQLKTGLAFLLDRFKLPVERVWVSVFEDDDEAFAIWRDEVSCAG